jgi:hypothetical protein
MPERGGFPGEAVIAVGRARHDALEKPEDAAHAFDAIERRDEMHFGRAGIRKTHIHIAVEQCADETLCAVQSDLDFKFKQCIRKAFTMRVHRERRGDAPAQSLLAHKL